MQRNLLRAGYGERRKDQIFLPFVLGALVAVLLFSFQVPNIKATWGKDPGPIHVQQKWWNGKPLLAGSTGTMFIYSFQPWGGVRFVNSDRPFVPSRHTNSLTLLRRSGKYPLSMAETNPVAAQSEMMTRDARPPTVQFLRSGNTNWITTF